MEIKLLLSLTVNFWFLDLRTDAQCTYDQQDTCRRSVSDTSLPSSGWCEAKEYVAFTHNCFRRLGHPVVDYCCCSHPGDGSAMCCRYVQAWNHYRCVESIDRINATLITSELNLPVVVPVLFVALGVAVTCLICCLIRCCYNHVEESKSSMPGTYNRLCGCILSDTEECKSQSYSPSLLHRSDTRVTSTSTNFTEISPPRTEGVFCLCRPRQTLNGISSGGMRVGCQAYHAQPSRCQAWVGGRASGTTEQLNCLTISSQRPPGHERNNNGGQIDGVILHGGTGDVIQIQERDVNIQNLENISAESQQASLNMNSVQPSTSQQTQNQLEMAALPLLPPYEDCSRHSTPSCDVNTSLMTSPLMTSQGSDVTHIAPPSYEDCIRQSEQNHRQFRLSRQQNLYCIRNDDDDYLDDDDDVINS